LQKFPLLKTEEELAKRMQELVVRVNPSLDEIHLQNLENYCVQMDIFDFTLLDNNILNLTSQITMVF